MHKADEEKIYAFILDITHSVHNILFLGYSAIDRVFINHMINLKEGAISLAFDELAVLIEKLIKILEQYIRTSSKQYALELTKLFAQLDCALKVLAVEFPPQRREIKINQENLVVINAHMLKD